ncbi:MAG TPA: molybdopterin converting factor subunit 1 [Alphaproteobacteria bacterium]|jgi:molybdopterin synthase sulfur carrier subunit|nr:molybdopterin converting factor subunit 1 [Alphaproteobacteria bacterium]
MKILYFAWIRQRIGKSADDLSVPAEVATVGELIDWLQTRGAGYAAAFADRDAVRMAVNQEHVDASHPVSDRDEVAFFPPVTGG